jgi:hypothetical protein
MHLLLILNASTNFLIYCFMGSKFKTVLASLVRDFIKVKGKASNNGAVIEENGAMPKKDLESKVNTQCNKFLARISLQVTCSLTLRVSPSTREPSAVSSQRSSLVRANSLALDQHINNSLALDQHIDNSLALDQVVVQTTTHL